VTEATKAGPAPAPTRQVGERFSHMRILGRDRFREEEIMKIRIFGSTAAIAGVLSLLACGSALAEPQSKEQQKCINALNKDGAKVAATQGKENAACIKNAGKGKVADAEACLSADDKGKVAKAAAKTEADFAGKCGVLPDFGIPAGTASVAVNAAAVEHSAALVAEIFGDDLNAAVVDCTSDKEGCLCQAAISKDYEKIAATAGKAFLKCKKGALKAGASDAASLESCVESLPGDAKLAKTRAKLDADVGGWYRSFYEWLQEVMGVDMVRRFDYEKDEDGYKIWRDGEGNIVEEYHDDAWDTKTQERMEKMREERNIDCRLVPKVGGPIDMPIGMTVASLLAKFFEIDEDKLEAEKRQMLDDMRGCNG